MEGMVSSYYWNQQSVYTQGFTYPAPFGYSK